ncbi:hypothetical protein JMJ77_0001324, partial [Colletotrichum scovillei]
MRSQRTVPRNCEPSFLKKVIEVVHLNFDSQGAPRNSVRFSTKRLPSFEY